MASLDISDEINSKYLVFGLGKTGLSIARHLFKENIDAIYYDSRSEPPEKELFEELFGKENIFLADYEESILENVSAIVVSPGISDQNKLLKLGLKKNIKIISDIDLYVESSSRDFVTVTGTNGKSTVTELISYICNKSKIKASAGGNLGIPALDLLSDDAELHILELSSFHLHRCDYLPSKVAVLLNISRDHLDWHGNEDHYKKCKFRILRDANSSVYNHGINDIGKYLNSNINVGFGVEVKEKSFGILEENNSFYLCYGKEKLINCNKLKLNGNHNYENILAALAASRLIGIDLSDALDAICSFQGLPHRMQSISNHNSIEYINDSKGTNVDAAIASISSLKKKVILLAGGQSKGGNFEQFAEAIKSKVKRAYLFGEDAKIIGNELNKFVPVVFVDNLEDAVILAKKSSSPGDVILLSPACASFDQFDSFIHRGKEFERIVGEITK